MATALASKPGLTGATALSIPKDWDATWFRNFINNMLKGADVRNAVGANGIVVSGTIASPYATISIGGSGPVTVTGGGLIIGTPTGGNEGAGTVNATGYYLNGVNQFQTGTFVGTLTGCTTAATVTCDYAISGKICTLSMTGQGTSNTTAMTMTGLPAVCQPAITSALVPCNLYNNGTNVLGFAFPQAASGTIPFYVGAYGGAFTNSGTKGLNVTTISYSLQ